ncbi:MAG: PHP domain-containing protein [Clostridia bacterium]|nr:PHP domain-containing protein [Clostridia bacterium]
MKEYEKYESILKEKYPCRIELHAHTSPASKCADFSPEDVVKKYKALGYDAIVITNHFPGGYENLSMDEFFAQYFGNFDRARAMGEKLGIKVFLGAELRFVNDDICPDNDYLLYGCTKEDLIDCYDLLHLNFRFFVNAFIKPRHTLIQAHPLRKNMVVCDSSLVDGYESFNMHPGHNAQISLAVRHADKTGKIFTAGTDFHHENHEGCAAVRFKSLPKDEIDLSKMLKENNFLIEIEKRILIP